MVSTAINPSRIPRFLLHLLALLKYLVAVVNVEGSDGGDGVAVHLHCDVMVAGRQSSEAGESLQRHHRVLRRGAGGAETVRDCSVLNARHFLLPPLVCLLLQV